MKKYENTTPLTRNAIKQMFSLELVPKNSIEVDLILQVITIKKTEKKNKTLCDVYQTTLSDGDYKYKGFLILKNESTNICQDYDIIRILHINPTKLSSSNERVFIIKNYELLENSSHIIGEPQLLHDVDSKEKFSVQNGDQDSHRNSNLTNMTNVENRNNLIPQNSSSNGNPTNKMKEQNIKIANHSFDYEKKRKSAYQPLSTLTTFSKDIVIYVKCTKKTELKNFNNNRGGGCLFSFYLLDSEGTEMPATCFNKTCEKIFPLIQEGLCYEINGGYIKVNDKKFTSVKSEYKLMLDENTRIEEKPDDGSIGELPFDFIQISDLIKLPLFSIVDIFGYVNNVTDKVIKRTKNGEQAMRKVYLVDTSGYEVEFTLWKQFCDFEINKGMVLCVRAAKIGDFNGRNLSSVDDTKILVDPIEKHATELKMFCQNYKDWKTFYSGSLSSSESNTSAPIQTIKEVLSVLETDPDDKIVMSKIKATICQINHSDKNFYPGCPDKNCKKKLVNQTYNWYCSSCDKTIDTPSYYYTISLRIKDVSSEHWVDIFGETGQKLFKINCEDYKDLVINRDEQRLKEISDQFEFKTFYFFTKPKLQIYQNIAKKKLSIFRIEPIELNIESKRLLKNVCNILFVNN